MNMQMQANQAAKGNTSRSDFSPADLSRRRVTEKSTIRQQKPLLRVRDGNRQTLRIAKKAGRVSEKTSRLSVSNSRKLGPQSIVAAPVNKQDEYATLARRRPKKIHILLALGVFCVLLGKLVIRLEIMELSYKVEGMRNDLLQQDAVLRELKARKAVLANPRKLIQDSNVRLELRGTRPQQIRRISAESSL